MAKLEVISSCLIRTATNEISLPRLELTPWDLSLLLLNPIQKGILFYKPKSQDFQTVIHHLKTTLSRTLDFFPPLAGRLGTIENDDNTTCFFVDCNNAGAEFTHAIAGAVSVSDILGPTYIPHIVSSFFPLNGVANCEGVSMPLLAVQATELVDGFFIGCTANHAVIDGTSFWHFFNSWSEISRGLVTILKTPVFERWFPSNISKENRLIPLPPLDRSLLHSFVPPPLLERVFHFSRESVAKLKAKANAEAGTDKISSLQALSAHLWRSVTRCRNQLSVQKANTQELDLVFVVGTRSRIPLPDGYFGNAVHIVKTVASEGEVLENGLGYATLKVNELVAQHSREATINLVEEWVRNPHIFNKGTLSTFAITSSHRHNVYSADFGWGKPIAVRSGKGQKSDGKMTLFPAAQPGGIDVEACLAPATLKAMEADAEFIDTVTI
ncbi:protein ENHANCEDSUSCEPTIBILITY 1 [Sesamum angolense]|uniref:Protein ENHANCEDSUSCEPTIBILITY 1 n=1 Tax=Sesamum angolense TaxID=2727404 RepID=A0AAE2BQX8_9LAMI|nr:protein ENHANCEDSUSCEPTIBILITY 1 [Sesamum angolense]